MREYDYRNIKQDRFQERSITKHCDSRGNSSGIFKNDKNNVFNKFQNKDIIFVCYNNAITLQKDRYCYEE